MQRFDTTFHGNGKIESVARYEGEIVNGLSQAQAFQRGLPFSTDPDTLYDLIEIRYFDEGGRPVSPSGDRPPERIVGKGQRHPFNKHFTTGKDGFSPMGSRYAGRVGVLLTDTVRVTNWESYTDTLRFYCDDPVLRLDTTVILRPRETFRLILPIRPLAGDRRIILQAEDRNGMLRSTTVTVEGFDLTTEDFADSRHQAAVFQVPREEIVLKTEGPEKLLRRRGLDGAWVSVPVGRGLDRISVRDWLPGDYPLELVDLGSGKKQYLTLRVP